MSLIVNQKATTNIEPVSEGTHLGVCYMLVDLGLQFNETFKNSSRKVLIGWELPDEKITLEDGEHNRVISKRYTASLNESANLRQDLEAWRGRAFTDKELEAFDLRNIVGTSCLINVVHRESGGKKYANVQNIMALPKGMEKGKPSETPVIFDLDKDPVQAVETLPDWIKEIVKKSETYQERMVAPVEIKPIEEDGDIPF